MSGLGDKMVELVTGGRGAPGDLSFREAAERLWRASGNQRAAAKAAGVDRRTFQRWFERWRAGKEPRPTASTRAKLTQGLRRAQLAASGLSESAVSLTVTERGGRQEGRSRTLTNGNFKLRPGTMQRVADAWVRTGDPEAAGDAFIDGITVKFYKRYLTPPPSARDTPAPPPGGGAGDDEDGDAYDDGEGFDPGEGAYDAYDEFDFDDDPMGGDPEDLERYGGDVTG